MHLTHQTDRGEQNTLQLNRVLHVPDLHDNLLSLTSLDKHGLHVQLGEGTCSIKQGDSVFGVGHLQGGIYMLHYPQCAPPKQSAHPDPAPTTTPRAQGAQPEGGQHNEAPQVPFSPPGFPSVPKSLMSAPGTPPRASTESAPALVSGRDVSPHSGMHAQSTHGRDVKGEAARQPLPSSTHAPSQALLCTSQGLPPLATTLLWHQRLGHPGFARL